ncbi:MAG: LamG domain-containing protein [Burkholderiaceae bacterium]
MGTVEQAVTINIVDGGQTIEITPDSGTWQIGATHTVTLSDTIESDTGSTLRNPLTYTFKTLDTASLVGWWEFDNSLADLSGNGNTIDTNQGVTFANDPTLHRSGTHAAYFDGSSYMVLNDVNFDLGDKFAVAFWVYIPTLRSNINTILANASANEATSGFKIGVNNWLQLDGGVILEGGNGAQGGKARTGPNFVQDGQWYHFAYNVDTTADLPNGRHVQIFFNGAEATVNYDGGSTGPMGSMDWTLMKTTGPLYFGAMVGGSYRLNGAYIDDLRIYNRSLTDAEVLNIAR